MVGQKLFRGKLWPESRCYSPEVDTQMVEGENGLCHGSANCECVWACLWKRHTNYSQICALLLIWQREIETSDRFFHPCRLLILHSSDTGSNPTRLPLQWKIVYRKMLIGADKWTLGKVETWISICCSNFSIRWVWKPTSVPRWISPELSYAKKNKFSNWKFPWKTP